MDLKRYEGDLICKDLFDSLGTELIVDYCPYRKTLYVDITDPMYNGCSVQVLGATTTIVDQKAEIHDLELAAGILLHITPPGGFTRSFPLNY